MKKLRACMVPFILFFFFILFSISCQKKTLDSDTIEVSGLIEAVETEIRSQVLGEVQQVLVQEGQRVKQGDILCLVDNEKLYFSLNQVKAGLQGAQAKLQLFKKGTKKELIAVAKNQLESAQKELELAHINQERMQKLLQEGAVTETQEEQADLGLKVAQERYESARENHQMALRGREKEEIAMVQAEIESLKAQKQLFLRQIKDSEVVSPVDGYCDVRHIEVGELALPGTILFSLIDLTRTYVRAYVPEKFIGSITTGDEVEVYADSFPDTVFKGTIDFISDKAEFAPRDIQTKEERLKLVFMVKSYLKNPERKLKSGMPVDVKIYISR